MKTYEYLKADLDSHGVARVRLARPPVNAVCRAMYVELAQIFGTPDQIGGNVRVIILSGDGPQFCAGHDLGEFESMTPENGAEQMWRVREAFFAIQECPVPVIGAVHGATLGTGLAIAASCDFLVAARDAKIGLPELTVGVLGGARHLARLAPQALVRRMFLTGDAVAAQELADAGGALVACDPGSLQEVAYRYAARIASFSPTAVRLSKQVLNRIETMDIRTGYEFEQRFTVMMSGHPDSKEALASFRERRPAHYAPCTPAGVEVFKSPRIT
jgi:enoyl-CoA hydratase